MVGYGARDLERGCFAGMTKNFWFVRFETPNQL